MSTLSVFANLFAWFVCVVMIIFCITTQDWKQAAEFFVLLVIALNSAVLVYKNS